MERAKISGTVKHLIIFRACLSIHVTFSQRLECLICSFMLHVISRYAKRDDLPRRALHRCPFRAHTIWATIEWRSILDEIWRGYAGQCSEAEKLLLPLHVSAKNVAGLRLLGHSFTYPKRLLECLNACYSRLRHLVNSAQPLRTSERFN